MFKTKRKLTCKGFVIVIAGLTCSFVTTPLIADREVRDPTMPPAPLMRAPMANPQGQTFQLDSILVSSYRQVAVINGRRVLVGDHVGDALVTHIQPDAVQLKASRKTIKLTKREAQFIRRPSK